MAHRTTQSRYSWSLILGLGFAWLALGCSPQTMTMFMLPFVDNKKEPEHKLFAADKEIKLVVTANFAVRQFQPEFLPADRELADSVANALLKRSAENKHTLKIVPQAEVRAFAAKQMSAEGDVSPHEIGRHFKADYVLDLTYETFGLYQKDGYPKMYRGTSRLDIRLYNATTKDEEAPIWRRTYNADYGGSRVPIEVGNSNPAEFRQRFMARLGRDISRMLVAFPLDELKEWD